MTQLAQEPTTATAGQPTGGWLPPPIPRPSSLRRLLSGLSLLVLVAGVPIVLGLTVGLPLPRSVPTVSDLTHVLSAPLAPSLIVNLLALVAWAAWAHFAVCVAVEIFAALRSPGSPRLRQVPRVPLGGVSQQLARRLVEAALMTATMAASVGLVTGSGTILTPARPAVAAAQELRATSPAAVIVQAQEPGTEPAATVPATEPVRAEQGPRPYPQYVVQPPHGGFYDSLWAVAERFLGDGQRWREIYELNNNRPQPDGRSLTRPDLIRPGWTLHLPADASGLPPADPQAEQGATPALPRDVGSAPVASSGSGSGATVLPSDPAGALPLPDASASAREPDALSPAARASAAPAFAPPSPAAPASTPAASDQHADGHHTLPVPAVSGLLAAAALASLATLRHRQRRRRLAGASIPLPPKQLAHAEVALRVLAEPADLTFLDEALRALTAVLPGHDLPDIQAALLRPDHLDLRLAAAQRDAPPPLAATDTGRSWRVFTEQRPLAPREALDQSLPLLPLLLTAGRDPDGPVLLDLEAVGSLAIDGPPTEVLGVLTHLAADAALAPWADGVEVLTVGFPPDLACQLELLAPDRVTAVQTLDAGLLRVLSARASRDATTGDRLAARLKASGADAREDLPPSLLVVHAASPAGELAEQLAALVPGAGLNRRRGSRAGTVGCGQSDLDAGRITARAGRVSTDAVPARRRATARARWPAAAGTPAGGPTRGRRVPGPRAVRTYPARHATG